MLLLLLLIINDISFFFSEKEKNTPRKATHFKMTKNNLGKEISQKHQLFDLPSPQSHRCWHTFFGLSKDLQEASFLHVSFANHFACSLPPSWLPTWFPKSIEILKKLMPRCINIVRNLPTNRCSKYVEHLFDLAIDFVIILGPKLCLC